MKNKIKNLEIEAEDIIEGADSLEEIEEKLENLDCSEEYPLGKMIEPYDIWQENQI